MHHLDELPNFFSGCDIGQRESHARKLPSEELGVRLSPFGNLTVEFGSGAVPPFLTILGKKDERRSV